MTLLRPELRLVKNDAPLVSIVTPTYNQAAFIERTILSVREQRYQNIEHIIIDAGSTDGTPDILRAYEGTYNMRWLSEADNGMYDGLNKGLALAKGDILAYINSDDYYLPWTIERVVAEFEEYSEAGLIFGDIVYFNEDTGAGCFRLLPPFWLGMLQRTGFLAQPGVFWRRQVMDTIGLFDSNLKFVGDCDYWMRAGQEFQIRHVTEILAAESIHGGTKHSQDPHGLEGELDMVRARYQTPGRRRKLLHLVDLGYKAFFAQLAFFRLAAFWSARRYSTLRPAAWRSFLTENPFPFSTNKLLLALVPTPRRVLGQGVVIQAPISAGLRKPTGVPAEEAA